MDPVVQLFGTPARLLRPWISPGQSTGVGSGSLLQGIFPTQGLNPGLLLCSQISHLHFSPVQQMSEKWVRFLGWEDPLEKEMATPNSILAWGIPGTVVPVGCRLWGPTELDTTEAT